MPDHVFGRRRPSETGGFELHVEHDPRHRDTHYRDLPHPTGNPPYHLDLATVLPAGQIQAITQAKKLVFHVNGDMGGIQDSTSQILVSKGMEGDFNHASPLAENPAFLYILGDCVYFNGEIQQYFAQFYHPYEFYPAPIFAVPGNHDGENLPGASSLDGFVRNFCAPQPVKLPESQDSPRTAMTQPNVFWTLLTPLATFVGLYSNVPEGGAIRDVQFNWLVDQLRTLPADRPLFLSLHHPVYSADDHHSGSVHMEQILERAFHTSGRQPEIIFAGHVHNYQRFTRALPGGAQLPYIVAGAGGYHNLHRVKKVAGQAIVTPVTFDHPDGDPLTLERYNDDHHGFLRLEVTDTLVTGRYYTVPRPQDPFSKPNQLVDHFDFDWRNRRNLPNHL